MKDEILEGVKRDRAMGPEFQKLIHGFVLDNTEHMEPYRRRYGDCVIQREQERQDYRREHQRGGRGHRFVYPVELRQLPEFAVWFLEEVRREQQAGLFVENMVLDTARGPLPVACAYKGMYSYGNHYRVLSSEQSLKTTDSGVAATFKQLCRNGIRDTNQVNADIEYVGHIEEILELNYRRHCLVVLVCDFVKANYRGKNATIKKDKWGFTLANYRRRYGNICRDSFAFPIHCEQVFYVEATEAPGWRVVLRKEVKGRRVLPNEGEDVEVELFQMGNDNDFDGLVPEREVGEEPVLPAATGINVVVEPLRRARRRSGCPGRRVDQRTERFQPVRRGRCGGRTEQGTSVGEGETNQLSEEEDERHEEEMLSRNNLGSTSGVRRRSRGRIGNEGSRRVRQRPDSKDPDARSGDESESSVTVSSTQSLPNSLEGTASTEGLLPP